MIVWLVVTALFLWTVRFRYMRRRMYELAARIPGSEDESPLLGIAPKLVGDGEDIMNGLKELSYAAMNEKGKIIRGWLGHLLYVVTVDPVDIEMVLKTCLKKDDLHRFLRKVIGNGGIFAPVSIWRRRRKILVPAFSPKIVETFVQVFSEQSEKLVRRLNSQVDVGSFSVWSFVSTYTLDSVCETAMGVKINTQSNPDSPFLNSMNTVLNLVNERIFHLWLQPDWLFKLFPQYPIHQKCLEIMHGFTDEVIRKKREEIKQEKEAKTEADNNYDLGSYKLRSFLDILIELSGGENGYTNIELREEVITLAIAGTDTSAVAIGNTLMLLAKYPKIQEQLYEELYEVFGDSERPLVKDDLMKLKYLERVVKESLRLFPPVPFIIRQVLEETPLPSGYTLPVGCGVAVSIWGIHRDPTYWGPNAEHFDPDRFLPERFDLKHACSFMPFSNGPRNCVGYQYALMSIKTNLSAILRRYKVFGEPEDGPIPMIRTKIAIMMKAVNNYQIALQRRKTAKIVTNGVHT